MLQRLARRTGFLCLVLSATGLVLMSACGGGGSLTTTTPPTTQPPPPPPQVVLEGSFALPVDFVTGGFFTTDRAGTIVATVDYTFATSQIVVWIARGQCTFEQFSADQCTYAATSFAGGDPRTVSITGAAAGTYTLIVFNAGPADEAFSVQVVLTPSAASASDESAFRTPVRPSGWFLRRLPHR
jgi:hypothetical protein